MKKIEVYVTDAEYAELEIKVKEFEACIRDHQDDGFYTDEERAEIINTYGAIPLYAAKGLKKKLKEMSDYIAKYSQKHESVEKNSIGQSHKKEISNTIEEEKNHLPTKDILNEEIPFPEVIFETSTENPTEFDFTEPD